MQQEKTFSSRPSLVSWTVEPAVPVHRQNSPLGSPAGQGRCPCSEAAGRCGCVAPDGSADWSPHQRGVAGCLLGWAGLLAVLYGLVGL